MPGLIKLFLATESFVTDLPAGGGKIAHPFLQCNINVADPDRQKLSINVVYSDTQKLSIYASKAKASKDQQT
jgi:hypothetical protein